MINITLIKLKFNHNKEEVEVDMEKCKKRNTEHCAKSKFCANRSRKNT